MLYFTLKYVIFIYSENTREKLILQKPCPLISGNNFRKRSCMWMKILITSQFISHFHHKISHIWFLKYSFHYIIHMYKKNSSLYEEFVWENMTDKRVCVCVCVFVEETIELK